MQEDVAVTTAEAATRRTFEHGRVLGQGEAFGAGEASAGACSLGQLFQWSLGSNKRKFD